MKVSVTYNRKEGGGEEVRHHDGVDEAHVAAEVRIYTDAPEGSDEDREEVMYPADEWVKVEVEK